VLDAVRATVVDLVGYRRVLDADLPHGAIEEAIAAGEVTMDEIVTQFRVSMALNVEYGSRSPSQREREALLAKGRPQ
jgi:hypothetical protein